MEIVETRKEGNVLGAKGRIARSETGRSARVNRTQRGGKNDATEDPEPDYTTHEGLGGDLRAGRDAAGSGNRIPSGAFRAGQYISFGRHLGNEQAGDQS